MTINDTLPTLLIQALLQPHVRMQPDLLVEVVFSLKAIILALARVKMNEINLMCHVTPLKMNEEGTSAQLTPQGLHKLCQIKYF